MLEAGSVKPIGSINECAGKVEEAKVTAMDISAEVAARAKTELPALRDSSRLVTEQSRRVGAHGPKELRQRAYERALTINLESLTAPRRLYMRVMNRDRINMLLFFKNMRLKYALKICQKCS